MQNLLVNNVEYGQLVKRRPEILSGIRKLLQGFAWPAPSVRPFFNVSPGITDVETKSRF